MFKNTEMLADVLYGCSPRELDEHVQNFAQEQRMAHSGLIARSHISSLLKRHHSIAYDFYLSGALPWMTGSPPVQNMKRSNSRRDATEVQDEYERRTWATAAALGDREYSIRAWLSSSKATGGGAEGWATNKIVKVSIQNWTPVHEAFMKVEAEFTKN